MKTIVAPTDFSPVSLNAVNYAADMAQALNADLVLLHVVRLPLSYSELPVPADTITVFFQQAKNEITRLREALLKRTEGRIVITGETREGDITTGICDLCYSISPYAIIMGTQGSDAIERFFFGSNTINAMKQIPWPLIVIPPMAQFGTIKKIGLACDMENVSDTIPLEQMHFLVKDMGAELHVIHISRDNETLYPPSTMIESGYLYQILKDLHPVYHFVYGLHVDEGLSEWAEKNSIDLLTIIPKKHNLLERLFHKSHTKQLILHTHVPLMSVHT